MKTKKNQIQTEVEGGSYQIMEIKETRWIEIRQCIEDLLNLIIPIIIIGGIIWLIIYLIMIFCK